jgi:hypothetical protein
MHCALHLVRCGFGVFSSCHGSVSRRAFRSRNAQGGAAFQHTVPRLDCSLNSFALSGA